MHVHYKQISGIHFKAVPPHEYRKAIVKGIEDGMTDRFPNFPKSGSIWITEITEDKIDSCERAFYKAGRAAIDQAYSLSQSK